MVSTFILFKQSQDKFKILKLNSVATWKNLEVKKIINYCDFNIELK